MKKKDLLKMIVELQERVARLEATPSVQYPDVPMAQLPFIYTPDLCREGKPHSYPQVWGGTLPPNCTVCGKDNPNNWTLVTCSTSDVKIDNSSDPCCGKQDPCCSED